MNEDPLTGRSLRDRSLREDAETKGTTNPDP